MGKRITQLLLASLFMVCSLVSSAVAQDGGTVTGTGRISVDNAFVQSGAKVTNGSTVATDADGDAIVDLGALGKITLRPNTIVKLNLSANGGEVRMLRGGSVSFATPAGVTMKVIMDEAKRTQIAVRQGEVEVEYQNKKRTLSAVHSRGYYDTKSVTSNPAKGESVFTINYCQCCFVEKLNP